MEAIFNLTIFGLSLATTFILFSGQETTKTLTDPLYLISMGLLMAFILSWIIPVKRKKIFKKIYDSTKTIKEPFQIKFNDKYSEWITKKYGSTKLYWNEIYDYRLSENILLLIVTIQTIRGIPLSAFENIEEKKKFIGYLEKNIQNKRR